MADSSAPGVPPPPPPSTTTMLVEFFRFIYLFIFLGSVVLVWFLVWEVVKGRFLLSCIVVRFWILMQTCRHLLLPFLCGAYSFLFLLVVFLVWDVVKGCCLLSCRMVWFWFWCCCFFLFFLYEVLAIVDWVSDSGKWEVLFLCWFMDRNLVNGRFPHNSFFGLIFDLRLGESLTLRMVDCVLIFMYEVSWCWLSFLDWFFSGLNQNPTSLIPPRS